MSLMDIVGGLMGGGQQGGGGGQGALLNAVVGMLANNGQGGNGLGGLVSALQKGGLGDAVSSWVGTGANQPVSPEQLQNALPPDMLGGLLKQFGGSQSDMMGQLSQMLPQVVDKLTPQGQVPQGSLGGVGDLLGMLMKR